MVSQMQRYTGRQRLSKKTTYLQIAKYNVRKLTPSSMLFYVEVVEGHVRADTAPRNERTDDNMNTT